MALRLRLERCAPIASPEVASKASQRSSCSARIGRPWLPHRPITTRAWPRHAGRRVAVAADGAAVGRKATATGGDTNGASRSTERHAVLQRVEEKPDGSVVLRYQEPAVSADGQPAAVPVDKHVVEFLTECTTEYCRDVSDDAIDEIVGTHVDVTPVAHLSHAVTNVAHNTVAAIRDTIKETISAVHVTAHAPVHKEPLSNAPVAAAASSNGAASKGLHPSAPSAAAAAPTAAAATSPQRGGASTNAVSSAGAPSSSSTTTVSTTTGALAAWGAVHTVATVVASVAVAVLLQCLAVAAGWVTRVPGTSLSARVAWSLPAFAGLMAALAAAAVGRAALRGGAVADAGGAQLPAAKLA